jgi:hypothetical protein
MRCMTIWHLIGWLVALLTLGTVAAPMPVSPDDLEPSAKELAERPRSMRFDPVQLVWGWIDEMRRRWSPRPTFCEVVDLALRLAPARAVATKLGVSPQTAAKMAADLDVHLMIRDGAARRLPEFVDLFGLEMHEPPRRVDPESPAKNGTTSKP